MSNRLNNAYADAFFAADKAVTRRKVQREKDALMDEYSEAQQALAEGTELAGERRGESSVIGGAVGCGVGIVAGAFGFGNPVTNCATGYKVGSGVGATTYDWGWYDDLEENLEDMRDQLEDFDFQLSVMSRKYDSEIHEQWGKGVERQLEADLEAFDVWNETFYNNWAEDLLYNMGPIAVDVAKTYGLAEIAGSFKIGDSSSFSPPPIQDPVYRDYTSQLASKPYTSAGIGMASREYISTPDWRGVGK